MTFGHKTRNVHAIQRSTAVKMTPGRQIRSANAIQT